MLLLKSNLFNVSRFTDNQKLLGNFEITLFKISYVLNVLTQWMDAIGNRFRLAEMYWTTKFPFCVIKRTWAPIICSYLIVSSLETFSPRVRLGTL